MHLFPFPKNSLKKEEKKNVKAFCWLILSPTLTQITILKIEHNSQNPPTALARSSTS